MTSNMNPKKIAVILGLAGVLLIGAVSAAGNFGDPEQVGVNVITLDATSITPNSATLRAKLTSLDSSYEGAVIFWNYTNKNTGEEYKGPAAFTNQTGETMQYTQRGLSSNKIYSFESYSRPLNKENSKSINSFSEVTTRRESLKYPKTRTSFYSSKEAMETLINSNNTHEILNKDTGNIFGGGGEIHQVDYSHGRDNHVYLNSVAAENWGGSYAEISTKYGINMTAKNKLFIDWIVDLNVGSDYDPEVAAKVFVGEDELIELKTTTDKYYEDNVREIDISDRSGHQNITIRTEARTYSPNQAEIKVYNLYAK
jgi:hypothetical protein